MLKPTYVFLIICFASSIQLAVSRSSHVKHQDASLEIIGGNEVIPHSLPEVVSLSLVITVFNKEYTDRCGGSHLSQNYVLTAAHCLLGFKSAVSKIGVHNIKFKEKESQWINVAGYVIHPSYNYTTKDNDIALVQLAQPAQYTKQARQVRLPTWADVNKTYVGESALVAGWGYTRNKRNPSDVLMAVKYPIISLDDCRRKLSGYNQTTPDTDICADTFNANNGIKNSCNGDSGGPLFIGEGENRTQVGIVSFGVGAGCEAEAPDVLVKVNKFLQFIQDNSDVKIADK